MKLVSFFSLDANELPDGRVELTRKIVDGLELMARHWPGDLVTVFAPRTAPDTNLDHEAFSREALPFRVVILEPSSPAVGDLIRDAALVQIGVDYRHVRIARECRLRSVPYVMVAEYNLLTRLQIAAVEERKLARRARRMVWEISQEAQQRGCISDAAGLQCNGTPSYDAWSALCRSSLLYFDSRVLPTMLAREDDVKRRGSTSSLRLAYSGRLISMKGVQHLPDVAARLRERGVPFSMRIYGGGPLEPELRHRLMRMNLENAVTLEGTLPFPALMERVRDDVDVFVCPHVQGDPSCTYIETMSCGVPIAGFDNEAWRGLRSRSEAGWLAPLGDARALGDVVADLHDRRAELVERARRAVDFAREHTFDLTFARRGEHLRSLARPARRAAS